MDDLGAVLGLGLAIAFFGWLTVHYLRRALRIRRILRRGVTAPGVCVRVESSSFDSDTHPSVVHTFGFRTADGRTVEFDEAAARRIRQGDAVTITYDPDAPDPSKAATSAGPGYGGPVRRYMLSGIAVGLVTLVWMGIAVGVLAG